MGLQDDIEKDLQRQEEEQEERHKKIEYENYDGEDRVISSLEAQKEFSEGEALFVKYNTGIKKLDRLADGFEEGELVVISGAQKNGKTSLAQTFTYNMCKSFVYPLWFTFEVSTVNFLKKFPDLPNFYIPRRIKSYGLKWIKERIIESQVKYRTGVVFIDHLHYLITLGQAVNASLLIGAIMRELKKIAIELKVVIFLLAHTQKVKLEKVPELADLRDSSFIAQEADSVMMIKRHGEVKEGQVDFDRTAGLYFLANRRTGELGHIELIYENNLFYEVSKEVI